MSKQIKDKHNRLFYEKPKASQMHVFNRAFRFGNSTTQTHCNDLVHILQNLDANKKPKIVGLLCDNGPDFNPASLLVTYYMGQLWKDKNLDQLIICSYAPRSSKFNPIEIAWGTLSTALAQITLVSDHTKYNFKENTEELKKMFEQALNELKSIWKETKYSGKKVDCINVLPNEEEKPYNNYADIKDAFYHGRNSENHVLCKAEMQFLLNHCIKRPYYLHFKKCQSESCAYCSANLPENLQALELLKDFQDQLPLPILLKEYYNGEHYPSFLDLRNNKELFNLYIDNLKKITEEKKKNSKICLRCGWFFDSNSDRTKHNRYCKK